MKFTGKTLLRTTIIGLSFGLAASGPAFSGQTSDVSGGPLYGPRCASGSQPLMRRVAVNEPADVPGGRLTPIEFVATFDRVVAKGQGICLQLEVNGGHMRPRIGGSSSRRSAGDPVFTFVIYGNGSDRIVFRGGLPPTPTAPQPTALRSLGAGIMLIPWAEPADFDQVDAAGTVLSRSRVNVLLAPTPQPVFTISRATLSDAEVGEARLHFVGFELARDVVYPVTVRASGSLSSPASLVFKPAAGGDYVESRAIRLEAEGSAGYRFYYKSARPVSAVTPTQIEGVGTNMDPRASVTVTPSPPCGTRQPVLARQPDGSYSPSCRQSSPPTLRRF